MPPGYFADLINQAPESPDIKHQGDALSGLFLFVAAEAEQHQKQ